MALLTHTAVVTYRCISLVLAGQGQVAARMSVQPPNASGEIRAGV